jgi:hypothetical protein
MKSNLLIPKISLLLGLCAIPCASSVFADEQVAFVWHEDNPISGEPDEPGYYLRWVWEDPDVGYSEYYFWTEQDFEDAYYNPQEFSF